MPGLHAVLAPSAAHRWLYCPGSIALTKDLPEESSDFAIEGTAAHHLAEMCLKNTHSASEYTGLQIEVEGKRIAVTEDMAAYVQVYIDYVLREAEGKQLLVEQKLPLTPLTGEDGARGTADAVIVDGGALTVIDLKFGVGVRVYAEENEQLMFYAAAALLEYSILGSFTKFRVVVVQPRLDHIDEWEFDLVRMAAFVTVIEEVAPVALKGMGALAVTEKGCRFCKAKATCPELSKQVHSVVSEQFDNLDKVIEADLSANMRAVDMVEGWCRAVRAEVERRLISGDKVVGYKLVQGRMGARAWTDAVEAARMMLEELKLPEDMAVKKTLNSPTAMEKMLKKAPEKWALLQTIVTQKEGPPSVAASTDPRPAIGSASEQFEVLA